MAVVPLFPECCFCHPGLGDIKNSHKDEIQVAGISHRGDDAPVVPFSRNRRIGSINLDLLTGRGVAGDATGMKQLGSASNTP